MDHTVIVSNQIKCRKCGDEIYSSHRHDMKTCSCGAVSVDGGNAYLKRTGSADNIEEQSIILPVEVVDSMHSKVNWAVDTNRNSMGITFAALRAIRDAGYKVVKAE